jgi:hypothetical protein
MIRRYGPKVRFLSSRIMCYSFQCRILITARSAWHWHTRWHLRYPRCELQWLLFSGCDAVKSVRTVPTFRSVLLPPTQGIIIIIIIIIGTTWLQGGQIPPPPNIFSTKEIFWATELKRGKYKNWDESGGKGFMYIKDWLTPISPPPPKSFAKLHLWWWWWWNNVGCRIMRNIGTRLPGYATSHSRRQPYKLIEHLFYVISRNITLLSST